MIDVNFNLISKSQAEKIYEAMLGGPTENRIVIAVNVNEKQSASGLYLPDVEQKELPKKGVIVNMGISNDCPVHESLSIGDVVLYGMYGGKEIYPTFMDEVEGAKDLKYFVLSSTEIIYVEPNRNL